MSMRYPGGFIASTPVTATYPSGVWTQAQAIPYQAQNVWTRDQYWPYTTLLLQGNGTNGAQNNTFLDSSSNNFTITRNGNTTQGSFTPYEQDGYWSNFFGGSSDYLTLANNAAFDLGTGDCTIEAWIFTNSLAATQAIFSVFPGSGTISGYTLLVNTSGTISMDSWVSGTNQGAAAGNYPISVGSWFHVAYTRSGGTNRIFVNGNLCTLSSNTLTQALNTGGNTPKIGYQGYSGFLYPFNGYISNLRIVKGTAVYTAAFTPSAAPLTAITNTSLLTCQSNRFRDNSTNNFTISTSGSPSVQAFQPFPGATTYSGTVLGGSGYYDGSGDYLSAPNNTALDLASGDFTVECWFYVTSVAAARPLIGRNNGNIATQSDLQYGIYLQAGGNVVVRPYQGVVTDYTTVVGTAVVNAWNHVALVRTGNTFYGFLNGVRGGTSQTISGALNTGSWLTYIGAGLSSGLGNDWMLGYIGDTRVVKGTALYTGTTYTVPTAPLTAIANTSLLLSSTNAGIFDAAVMNDLETVGNAQVSTSVVKYGTGSMAFDGNGDYLLVQSTPNIQFGSGSFTIEGWVYSNSISTPQVVLARRAALNAQGIIIVIDPSALNFSAGDSNTSAWEVSFTSSTLSSNTWYHFAFVRDGSSWRAFVNGVQIGTTTTWSGAIADETTTMVIGANSNLANGLNGYIDDLRITKGVARYLTSFTPPPARMPGQ